MNGLTLLVVFVPFALAAIVWGLSEPPEDRRRSYRPYRISGSEWRYASWRGVLAAFALMGVLCVVALVLR